MARDVPSHPRMSYGAGVLIGIVGASLIGGVFGPDPKRDMFLGAILGGTLMLAGSAFLMLFEAGDALKDEDED